MKEIAVFASGGGSNFKSIQENIESGNILVPDDNSFGLDFDISIMKKRANII